MKFIRNKFSEMSIRSKVVFAVLICSIALLVSNFVMYAKINGTISRIDSVYETNVSLNDFALTLENVQNSMFTYLNTKSSTALEDYYRYETEYRNMCEQLNTENVNNDVKLMEKTIYNLSSEYLDVVSETIQAKRGRNINKYNATYEEATKIYEYLNAYINSLNSEQFLNNSNSYKILLGSLQAFEVSSIILMLVITAMNVALLMVVMQNLMRPLQDLVVSANEVAGGNLDIELVEPHSKDEVGVVTTAFNSMVVSIQDYIRKFREKLELENEMKEKEFQMETHLKDAQLKYLQAQINPHFLFNTLNAGAQLAMMEDAEKTCLFIENMADLFRYNVRKLEKNATLKEELQVVDNYMYIINVRFSNEITYKKQFSNINLEEIEVPSMIIQPIIENAVNYGIRDIEWPGEIEIEIMEELDEYIVIIKDNGKGIDAETIKSIEAGLYENTKSNSTGIGLTNVLSRLKLFYGRDDVFSIQSEGMNKGTKVYIYIPKEYDRINAEKNILEVEDLDINELQGGEIDV